MRISKSDDIEVRIVHGPQLSKSGTSRQQATQEHFHWKNAGHLPRLSQQLMTCPWSAMLSLCTATTQCPDRGQRFFDVVA